MFGIGVGHGRHLDQFGAEQAQHVLLFLRLRLGDDDDGAVAERVGDQAEADAGVAGRALDDDAARPQRAARHRVADDGERGAVLDRAAGVHELGLAEDLAARRLRRRAQADQRRVADGIDDIGWIGIPTSRGRAGIYTPYVRCAGQASSMTLTWAATMSQPSGNRTQVCIWRPTFPGLDRGNKVAAIAKSRP